MPVNPNLSPEARAILAEKTIVPIVGISAIGKDTLIERTIQHYGDVDDMHRASGFTTRPADGNQANDSTYRAFLPNTEKSRAAIFAATGEDELVQYKEHPTTGFLYGTTLQDFAGTYNLLPTLSGEVDTLRGLGFRACRVIVLCALPSQWEKRFNKRPYTAKARNQRIAEGIESLTWAFDNKEQVMWLANPDGRLDVTAEQLESLITVGDYDAPLRKASIETARKLLKKLESLQN